MKAEEYVIHSFGEHFAAYKNKNIVIYGSGPNTEKLLQHYSDYNIIGLLDGNRRDGELYGKRILNLEDPVLLDTDIIVVVAHRNNIKTIYDRISDFCYSRQIRLYGINGKNLFDFFGSGFVSRSGLQYFQLHENELKRQIDAHDTISFDVFDTLIMRKTLFPADVFDIVGYRAVQSGIELSNFREIRIHAEQKNPLRSANLYDIYDHLQNITGISDTEHEKLLQLEIEVEKQIIVRRETMVQMLEYALRIGKKVYLISDMYLPNDAMTEILFNCGIRGYHGLFVSCDYGRGKWEGLFDDFKRLVPSNSYLHIGDNEVADGISARRAGINAFLIRSALHMAQISTYESVLKYAQNTNDRSLIGLMLSRVFNNPFCLYGTQGKPKLERAEELGYLFMGPFITNFMLWLFEELRQGEYDDVLFSARDGFLIEKLYSYSLKELDMKELPAGLYFHSSRMMSTAASIEDVDDITWLANYRSELTPEQMLEQRFGLLNSEIMPYSQDRHSDLVEYALAHSDSIYARSEQIKINYLKYMNRLGLERGKIYALFDFCAIGTSQYFLSKIVPFQLKGLFVCRYYDKNNRVSHVDAKAMLHNYSLYGHDSYFYANYYMLETIMTSFEPSLTGMDNNGSPIYAEEVRSEKQLEYVRIMQQAIETYYYEYMRVLYIEGQAVHPEMGDRLLNLMDEGYSQRSIGIFDNIVLIDDMGWRPLEIQTTLT
ncbi:hypothetical protein PAT3040_01752 [Paenibacillus agaridevorans]|uniref:Haloacid dehalogenase n=1 Tax=Paenibacillus agaridevorans TaxID=171404 RepID=A0A2R5EV05_9BACL|nr:hypothetical protein [Paenibacillus agaridevorans]GBG07204.1 hypothetical protein PAT3040_01752 [Paenibacillus agaridevorans]